MFILKYFDFIEKSTPSEIFTQSTLKTTARTFTPKIESTTFKEECRPGWSEWYNKPRGKYGDYESLDSLESEDELPCLRKQITDIECKFYKNVTR